MTRNCDVKHTALDAGRRDVWVRAVLDPNRDAFGHEKPGIPNRQAAEFLRRESDGAIALQGSIWTLTEMLVAWNAAFIDALDGSPARPVVVVGDTWRDFVGMIGERLHTDASLVACVPDIAAAVAEITRRVPIRSR